MSSQLYNELRDEDMRRALNEARESLRRADARPQSEKEVARKSLLRWLDRTPAMPATSYSEAANSPRSAVDD